MSEKIIIKRIQGRFISEKEYISGIEYKLLNDKRVSRKEHLELYQYLSMQNAKLRAEIKNHSSQQTLCKEQE